MSIYREWTDRHDSLNYGLEPLGIWIIRQAALDRTHYAEVEAKHRTEVSDLRKDLKEALDYQVHLQRGWGQANAERDKAREALKSRCADGCEKTLSSLYRAEIERDEARAEIEKLKTGNKDLADAATAYRTERNEARAELAKIHDQTPRFFSEAVQDGRLQRPIGRNEHDRRISRLEAKVANLELGGAR